MNNMPYAALGGVMTGDVNERAKLNSFRFVAVNAAQFIVGGFTLPLVAKFAGRAIDRQYGWQMTMTVWAVLCLVLFLITFLTTQRTHPAHRRRKILAEAGFCRPAQKQSLESDVVHDAGSFCHSLVPRRRALQLLPSLRRQGGDV